MSGATAPPPRQRLRVYNAGFLTEARVRRILSLAGWDVSTGLPRPDDWIGIWGRSPTAWRGEAMAERSGRPVLSVEDAFLRSVRPRRLGGEGPVGLCIDRTGVHFDGGAPSDLETLLAKHPLDDTALLDRARDAVAQLRYWHLNKYSATLPDLTMPDPGYVVVIDQTEGDAALMGAGRAAFREMLAFAAEENPGLPILIKTHPETAGGARRGHFGDETLPERVRLLTDPVSPHLLFEGAAAVYTHSSTLGFEAIFAGLRPRVFGQPFYAGWGLTKDENAPARRERRLTRAQLFAAAMILYPLWYDPVSDRLCEIEDVIGDLAARAHAWREDRGGYVMGGMRRWKRGWIRRAFGRTARVRFARTGKVAADLAQRDGARPVVWGMSEAPEGTLRMEDGFLRSAGLGAALVPPLSVAIDAPSLYYDPQTESRLDRLIASSDELPLAEIRRVEALIRRIIRLGVTKYNIPAREAVPTDTRRTILVAGQVEDDASVLLGAPGSATNLGLLSRAREENPEARILWKAHPDVEAGFRAGAVPGEEVARLADADLGGSGAAAALDAADEVWTMTSTLGFEALLRGLPVVCLGMPFYAGWGLTRDTVPAPPHRGRTVSLSGLAHACLIGYPRYFHPVSGRPISPEAAVTLLAEGHPPPPAYRLAGLFQRLLRAR